MIERAWELWDRIKDIAPAVNAHNCAFRLRAVRDKISGWINARLDWMADRVEGRPSWDLCRVCGRPAHVIYLMPLPFGIERRCESCREGYHQAIRDFYAHRAALHASIRHCAEQRAEREATREAA